MTKVNRKNVELPSKVFFSKILFLPNLMPIKVAKESLIETVITVGYAMPGFRKRRANKIGTARVNGARMNLFFSSGLAHVSISLVR